MSASTDSAAKHQKSARESKAAARHHDLICPAPYQRPESPLELPLPQRSDPWPELLRVFGRLPFTDVMGFSEAGVRKASREETAGKYVPAAVSVYGDLTRL